MSDENLDRAILALLGLVVVLVVVSMVALTVQLAKTL